MPTSESMDTDVIIVGAGPAGLSLAQALGETGLSIIIIDQQRRQALADPAFDGRDIMLTHQSIRTLADLGVWPRLLPTQIDGGAACRAGAGSPKPTFQANPECARRGALDRAVIPGPRDNHLVQQVLAASDEL